MPVLAMFEADAWISIWQYVVVAAIAVFGIMGVFVGYRAVGDLFSMLGDLSDEDDTTSDE